MDGRRTGDRPIEDDPRRDEPRGRVVRFRPRPRPAVATPCGEAWYHQAAIDAGKPPPHAR